MDMFKSQEWVTVEKWHHFPKENDFRHCITFDHSNKKNRLERMSGHWVQRAINPQKKPFEQQKVEKEPSAAAIILPV